MCYIPTSGMQVSKIKMLCLNWGKGYWMNSSSIRGRKIDIEEVFTDVLVWQNLHSLQSTTNHKLQETGLQSGNYFCKDFAYCWDCVQLNYLENRTLWAVAVSITTQVDTLLLLLFVTFQELFSVTSADVWVVLVNFWLGLAYHTEEASSYTDTGKIWTKSSHVRKRAWNVSRCSLLLIFYLGISLI